jgi:hypothetical protein
LKSVAAVQSGLTYDEIEDLSKLKGPNIIQEVFFNFISILELKIPKFPKSDEKPASSNKITAPNTHNEVKNHEDNENSSFHQEIYERPKVSLLSNLEATVNLNGEDTWDKKPIENKNTPIFSLLNNDSVSMDLEGFKLHPADLVKGLAEEDKDFRFSDDFNQKVSTNLSFLKSVNQMPVNLENKASKIEAEPNIKKIIGRSVEIIDYVLMKKGYLDSSYYIYKISTRKDDKNLAVVERRYSDFEWLHTYLSNHPKYQGLLVPKLPEKHGIGASFFNYLSNDAEFIKKRKNVNFGLIFKKTNKKI